MAKPIPTIRMHMTTAPHGIGADQPLALAHQLMKKHDIRHLPVLDGGVLVGMLTERDLHLIETLRDVDPKTLTVEEAMSSEIYSVSPDAALDEVVTTMAERKLGSAVIMDHGHVVGIFTTVDACRTLASLLYTRLSK
jgi:acetoin utilization protein AcuB